MVLELLSIAEPFEKLDPLHARRGIISKSESQTKTVVNQNRKPKSLLPGVFVKREQVKKLRLRIKIVPEKAIVSYGSKKFTLPEAVKLTVCYILIYQAGCYHKPHLTTTWCSASLLSLIEYHPLSVEPRPHLVTRNP